jgi:hypothetical protein
MFGLYAHNYFFRVAYAPLVKWRTRPPAERFRWFSSAHLNQSLSAQTAQSQLHAEEWHSHAVPAGCLPASNTLRLPSGKRSWQCPADAVLPQREQSQHNSALFSAKRSRWRGCRFQARHRDRRKAFQGQHLDVALWEGVPQKDLSGGCRGDAAEACSRVKAQVG